MVNLCYIPTPRLSNLYRRGQEDYKRQRWWVTSGKLVLDIARSVYDPTAYTRSAKAQVRQNASTEEMGWV